MQVPSKPVKFFQALISAISLIAVYPAVKINSLPVFVSADFSQRQVVFYCRIDITCIKNRISSRVHLFS